MEEEEEEEALLEMKGFFGSWMLTWTGILFSSSGICLELESGGCGSGAEQAQLVDPPGVAERPDG